MSKSVQNISIQQKRNIQDKEKNEQKSCKCKYLLKLLIFVLKQLCCLAIR